MDLRELLELAHNVEDDALSENGGQPQTLSSIYYFLFSKTGYIYSWNTVSFREKLGTDSDHSGSHCC
jgi:hypothetical protein